MKITGIYCIENLINGKKYVGQGLNVEKRMWQSHKGCVVLLHALSLYGSDNFKRYVVEYCPKENLEEREKYYIKSLKSHVSEGGYNISWGGNAPFTDRTHSEETIQKMKKSGKNKIFSETHKQNISKSHMGDNNPMSKRKGKQSPFFGRKKWNSSSEYFGVSWLNSHERWVSRVLTDDRVVYVGEFRLEKDAAKAYDDYVILHALPNPLNFQKESRG